MTWKRESIRHALASKGVMTAFSKSRVRDIKESLSQQTNEYVDIKPPKEFRNPVNIGETIQLFWWCNSVNDYTWFPFNEAFQFTKETIRDRLDSHFSLPYEEQKEMVEKLDKVTLSNEFAELCANFSMDLVYTSDLHESSHVKVNKRDLKKILDSSVGGGFERETNIDKLKEGVDNPIEFMEETLAKYGHLLYCDEDDKIYEELQDLYITLNNTGNINLEEKVVLFDKIIDTEHHRGSIFSYQFGTTGQPDLNPIEELREHFEEEYT